MRGCGSPNSRIYCQKLLVFDRIILSLQCDVTFLETMQQSSQKCSLEFLSYNWRREDEPVTRAAFTSWQSSFPVAVKTCMAHSHGSNCSLYQQMSGWEWDHCCSCNDERDCNVFQIFCSSACIKVISETLCWSYQCLRTLQFVCHVGEVTETGIFVHHKSHANREGKLLQLKLTKNLISGRSC